MRMCILPRGGWHPRGPVMHPAPPSPPPGGTPPLLGGMGAWSLLLLLSREAGWLVLELAATVFSDSNTFSIHTGGSQRTPSDGPQSANPTPFHPGASWLPAHPKPHTGPHL